MNDAPTVTEFRKDLKKYFDVTQKHPINVIRGRETYVLMTRKYYAQLINRINGAIDARELQNIGSFIRIRTETAKTALPT